MMDTKVEIKVFPDHEVLSRFAAEWITILAKKTVAAQKQFHFVLSGGSTPEFLYSLLARSSHQDAFPWANTHVYWGDERCVPPEDAGSNYGQAQKLLLSRVPISANNIHRIKGELTPEEAAKDYADHLMQLGDGDLDWPRFDVVLLGMGDDGHTASLFPGPFPDEAETSSTIPVTALYGDRPANRVTLTPRVINSARHIMFLVKGVNKQNALTAVLEGAFEPDKWPAQRINPTNGHVMWLLDQDAAGTLS